MLSTIKFKWDSYCISVITKQIKALHEVDTNRFIYICTYI